MISSASQSVGAIPTAGPANVDAGRSRFGPINGNGGFRGLAGPPRFNNGNAFGNGNGNTGGPTFGGGFGGAGGGAGGLLDASAPDAELTAALRDGASDYRWVAATVGANGAAGYQLASDEPVMAIGGFNGTDPTPTLAQVQQYVANGDIHYFITGGRGSFGRLGASNDIASWVEQNFPSTTIGNVTVYDLTTAG